MTSNLLDKQQYLSELKAETMKRTKQVLLEDRVVSPRHGVQLFRQTPYIKPLWLGLRF